jgi:hypothetical protein
MPGDDRLTPDTEERLRKELKELRAEIKDVARGRVSAIDTARRLEAARDLLIADAKLDDLRLSVKAPRVPARGEPMELSQSDVDELARGETRANLATRLASRPMVFATRPEEKRRAAFGPVELNARDIEVAVTAGDITASLQDALEAAAMSPGRFGKIKDAAESGKERPQIDPEKS